MSQYLRPMLASFLTLLLGVLISLPATAAPIDAQFTQWLSTSLWPEARERGISEGVFRAALDNVKPNLKLPDLVLPGQSKPTGTDTQYQAEFRAPEAYFASMAGLVASGQRHAKAQASLLERIEQAYGVPRGIVLAIWGRETGYGTAKLNYNAFEVLGTKAFLATRKDMFRAELLAALEMVQKHGVAPQAMRSSWAGALGHPQFMPTSYLKYAVDFDGDGRADIWNSVPDALGSIAHYLARHGWVKGRDWGFEVRVPDSVSCSLEGPDRGRPISEWGKSGVERANGKAFPAQEARGEGYLMLPAGRHGPAFVVTPNFYRLKDYNESDLYALFIGHAADRITYGGTGFLAGWDRIEGFSRGSVADMQRGLEKLGHDVGGADGLVGFKTRRSIGLWQVAQRQPATCYPDRNLVKLIR